MEIVLQTHWGWEIAMDLFLGGLGASCFLIASILFLSAKDRFKKTVRFGAWASVISLLGAVAVLMLHVGIPGRAILLYESFINFDSWMPVGAWSIFCGMIIFGLFALSNTELVTNKIRFLKKCRVVLAILGIPFSLLIVGYTGLLLSVVWAHPLWDTMWLPILVVVSAFCMAVVLMTGYSVLHGNGEDAASLQKKLKISSIALLALTGIVLSCYLSVSSSTSEIGKESVQILTSGSLSSLFWYIAIACGIVIPLLISTVIVIRRELATVAWGILPMISIVLCLGGAFTMRLVILMAGLPIYA
jgi:formate-dependent nitrite reductase membrane component NrfD